MANESGYSVGNLSIAFNTLDKTGEDFKNLATNLRAIVNLINKISTADLGKFTANIKEITRAFSPFLTKIEKSTAGLQAFNNVARQIGVRNMLGVITELTEIQQATRETAEAQERLNAEIENGTDNVQIIEQTTAAAENMVATFSKFDEARAQVAKLSNELLNLHFESGEFDESKVGEMLTLTEQIKATTEAFKRLQMTEEEKIIADYQQINAIRKQRIAYLEATLAMGTAGESTRAYRKELEKLREEEGKQKKKGALSILFERIKRISVYRLIRSGIKEVTNAFKEGVKTLAEYDSGINYLMSQVKTSTAIIKTSMGATLLPILQAIQPILQQISVGFANMANVINASMSTTGKYTKINTDRLLAYNKAATLFDFDKFRTLNKGDETTGLLSTENVEDLNDELGSSQLLYSGIFDVLKSIGKLLRGIFSIVLQIVDVASPIIGVLSKIVGFILKIVSGVVNFLAESKMIEPILYGILTVLTLIGISKIVTWIQSGGITKALTGLVGILKQIPAALSVLNKAIHTTMGQFALWGTAVAAVVGAIKILSNWDDFSKGTKIAITVISSLIAVLTTAAIAAMALHGALTVGIAVPLIVTAVAAGAVAIGGTIKGYANGGMPDKGSMFVAGEAGAEFVYNMPSGQSGVANIQQIAQAEYQGTMAALNDWWKSARNDLPQFREVSATGLYQVVDGEYKRRGKRSINV